MQQKSFIISAFEAIIEFGNRYITLSNYLFKSGENIFLKLEIMMITMVIINIFILNYIHIFPIVLGIIISILLFQRILEFLIIYSRYFILNKGRLFSDFKDPVRRSQWLILMFGFEILQITIIYATWYRLISYFNNESFNKILSVLDSFYFSVITTVTVGYGDIYAIAPFPKILVITQILLTFYILVIVINGLISLHFKN